MKSTAITNNATTTKLQFTVRPMMVSTLSLPRLFSRLCPSGEEGGANSGICTSGEKEAVATMDDSGSFNGQRTIQDEEYRAGHLGGRDVLSRGTPGQLWSRAGSKPHSAPAAAPATHASSMIRAGGPGT